MNILYANLCQLNSKYLGMFTTHTKKSKNLWKPVL